MSLDRIELWKHYLVNDSPVKSPFLTYDFARAVNDVRGNVFVSDIQLSDSTRGFLPFQMRIGLSAFGHGEKVGASMSDYFGIVGNITTKLDKNELLKACGLSALRLDHVIDEMCHLDFLDKEVSQGVLVHVPDSAQHLKMLAARDREFVKSVARSERRFEREVGPLYFEWQSSNTSAALEWIVEAKRAQYRRTGATDELLDSWKPSLMRRLLCQSRSSECQLVISTLVSNGKWVAASVNLRFRDLLHIWFPVYSYELRGYGLGHILFLKIFERLSEHGISAVDFGNGKAAYKLKYQGDIYTLSSGVARRRTPSGLLDKVVQSIEWRKYQLSKLLRTKNS